jgi:peptidoglycan/xylan/chitin deacetylase (PgdA/CDA1 family)
MKKLFILFFILAFTSLKAQTVTGGLFNELFNYNLGALAGQGSWVEGGSFSGGTPSRTVVSGALIYNNSGGSYVMSGLGNSMLINIPSGIVTTNYYHTKPFPSTSVSSGIVYLSFLMRVNANTGVSNQEAFGLSNGTSAGPKVLIGATTAGFYKIGVVKGSTSSADYKYASSPTQLSVGTTYLIVLKHNFSTLTSSVYINPIIGGSEPSTPEVSDGASSTNRTPLNSFWSRTQGSTVTQNINISGARVSDNWTDAVQATVVQQNQTITFPVLVSRNVGDADFSSGATASSGLVVSLSSSNTAVATILDGKISVVGVGSAIITASQSGNSSYFAASDVSQTLVVDPKIEGSQTITFPLIPTKGTCQADFSAGATASSNLPVSLDSSNPAVATIVNGNIHIVGAGTSIITASQLGDNIYNPAANVTQNLTVTTVSPPTTADQSLCNTSNPTVALLTATGTALRWYTSLSEVDALATSTPLTTGIYYVSQTLNTCESTRTSKTVTITTCTPLKIILKLDDFYSNAGNSTSTPTLDYLVSKKIKAGLGFVSSRNDETALSIYSSYLNQTNANGEKLFEIWNHGYDHINPEFDGTTYAYQKKHFDDANQGVLDNLRIQMRSFGSPYNANDATTNTVISENPNYKLTMFNSPAPSSSATIHNINRRVNFEASTGNPLFSTFKANYDNLKDNYTDYMILQGHPYDWTSTAKLNEFKQIIEFLISEGVEFITPFDYYLRQYPTFPLPNTSQTITFPPLVNKNIDFDPGATSTSGLAVTYNSSNSAVATIVNGKIHLTGGSGNALITASQMGNATYKPANYVSQTLNITSVQFRSNDTGDWNNPSTWQISDAIGNWTTSTTLLPSANSTVYLQNGHTITVSSAEASCYDLHINTAAALKISTSFNVSVKGKIRAYSGSAVTSSIDDGFTGTSTTSLASTMITTTSNGVLKFVGGTRNITNTGEWTGSGTTNKTIFALDIGAIGTLQTAIKFKEITIVSGTVSTVSTINVGDSAGNGILTINSGAKLVSTRTYSAAGSQIIDYNSTSKTGTITIDSGGTLEILGANPVIDCTIFENNGTVIYGGGAQSLLNIGAGAGNPITSYTNLIISGAGAKTIPANTNITVSGVLNFAGSGNNIITGTNTLTLETAASISGAGTGWVIGNLKKLSAFGTSPSFTYPLGDATDYTPLTLTFSGTTFATGGLTATINSGDHPQIATSGLLGSKSVNRNWTLTNDALAGFGTYNALFRYASANNDAMTTPTNYVVKFYSAAAWSSVTTSGTTTNTAATATSITGFGDFAIGEIDPSLGVSSYKNKTFTIYPNPINDGVLYINSNSNSEKSLEIYDLSGKKVFYSNNISDRVEIKSLKNGVYFAVIKTDKEASVQKIIIKYN